MASCAMMMRGPVPRSLPCCSNFSGEVTSAMKTCRQITCGPEDSTSPTYSTVSGNCSSKIRDSIFPVSCAAAKVRAILVSRCSESGGQPQRGECGNHHGKKGKEQHRARDIGTGNARSTHGDNFVVGRHAAESQQDARPTRPKAKQRAESQVTRTAIAWPPQWLAPNFLPAARTAVQSGFRNSTKDEQQSTEGSRQRRPP